MYFACLIRRVQHENVANKQSNLKCAGCRETGHKYEDN